MFVVGSMPNAGSSFTNYLLGPLKFTDLEYMVVGLVGIVCSTIGIFMYVCGVEHAVKRGGLALVL